MSDAALWEPPISEDRLLLRELTHRVKNELAVAISLVSLAASRSSSGEVKVALATVEQRLHNHAQVHRCLEMPSHHTQMDASEHLRRLCQSISRYKLESRGIELLLVERPLQMDSERCWRLGMIISELITNSARHAFGNGGGKIQVELMPSGAFAKCRVADDGRAPAKVRPGGGFNIVEALVASLDGTIERHFGPRGAASVLTFPISPAARTGASPRSLPGRPSARSVVPEVEQGGTGATSSVDPAVDIFPADTVKRRRLVWPGMAAEIVQATKHERIETRFCANVHLLAAFERGVREEGDTFVEGLPRSTLRDFRQKLIFVPAGHEYCDWQKPRILSRVVYFYFDPTGLAISPELGFADMSFAPRLFFENSALWHTALKLTTLVENAGTDHRLYVEALGVVLAHELVRLNAGTRGEPQIRGGLAVWQQRTVVAYIEENLGEPISLATLARLVRLSPYYFCRAFKQSFGVPPHRYHTSRRIEHAKTLLAKPAPSVTDIGLTVGFSQTSSFIAAFRRATGRTPTAYHRSLS